MRSFLRGGILGTLVGLPVACVAIAFAVSSFSSSEFLDSRPQFFLRLCLGVFRIPGLVVGFILGGITALIVSWLVPKVHLQRDRLVIGAGLGTLFASVATTYVRFSLNLKTQSKVGLYDASDLIRFEAGWLFLVVVVTGAIVGAIIGIAASSRPNANAPISSRGVHGIFMASLAAAMMVFHVLWRLQPMFLIRH